MRLTRIFTNADLHPDAIIELEQQASHHLTKVLRYKAGASLRVFNGQGGQYDATVMSVEKKSVYLKIHQLIDGDCESPLTIHLGIAISRGDRMDHIMQKTTELGVSIITPLFSERSEVKLAGQRLEKKLQHWQHIIINACEQCGRNKLPILHHVQSVTHWCDKATAKQKLVLHHRTDQQLTALSATNSVALLIGPEGGLSQIEIQQAQQQGFTTLSLGPRVLRTETAPLAAISLLQHCWGDM